MIFLEDLRQSSKLFHHTYVVVKVNDVFQRLLPGSSTLLHSSDAHIKFALFPENVRKTMSLFKA